MTPSASVVIPTFNRTEYLGECLASIRAQARRDIEVILVDDGSTDGHLDRLNATVALQNVVLIRHPQNRGASEARNTGVCVARGEYIVFIDSDDLLEPHYLETAFEVLNRDPAIGLFCCDSLVIDTKGDVLYGGKTFQQIQCEIKRYRIESGVRSLQDIFEFSTSFPGFLVRRDVFKRVGYLDQSLFPLDDYDFQLRVAAAGYHVYYYHAPLARYRMHGENESGPKRMVRTCTKKVESLEIALRRNPELRALGWRARLRLADARFELAVGLLKDGSVRKGLLALLRSLLDHPAQSLEFARLVWGKARRQDGARVGSVA